MKWLIVIVLVWVAWLLWRQGRIATKERPAAKSQSGPQKTQEMVSCAHCAVHLPRADAVTGGDGRLYCSQEHRLAAARK